VRGEEEKSQLVKDIENSTENKEYPKLKPRKLHKNGKSLRDKGRYSKKRK